MKKKEIFKKIAFVYVLVLLPYLVGYKVKSFDSFTLLNNLSFVTFLLLPSLFFKKIKNRKAYWIVYSILVLAWSLTETLHILQEKKEFNYLALKIFFESNPRELWEYFVAIVPLWGLLGSLIAIFLLIYGVLKFSHVEYFKVKKEKMYGIGVIVLGLCVFLISIKTQNDVFGIFKNEALAYQKLEEYYDGFENSHLKINSFVAENELSYKPTNKKNTWVLIIGESTSKHHLGLYGYFRNTNPLLTKRNDIRIYQDVISSGSSTVECLGKCLTFNDSSSEKSLASPNIIDICNKLNFKTFWISNQNKSALVANSITKAFSRAQKTVFLEDLGENRYDEALIPELNKALKDTTSSKLIVLHMMGTHFEYKVRYPESFAKFKSFDDLKPKFPYANSERKMEIVNAYDNAVLYDDFVLNQIFDILTERKSKENISAIYFSDHADEVFDTQDYLGHTPGSSSNWLHEIPLITWNFNNTYNLNSPFEMDEFAISLCDWMQIKSKAFVSKKSLFDKNYLPQKRYLSTGKVYLKEG